MGILVAGSAIKPKKTETSGNRISSLLLFILILAVCVGPRLRISGEDGDRIDIRYQDILLIPAMFHLFVSNAGKMQWPLFRLLGFRLPIFLYGAFFLTIIVAFTNPDVDFLRRTFFLGRGFELFALAAVTAGLYLSAGTMKAPRAALMAVYLAAYGNAAWMAYQMVTGDTGTLLGSSVGATIESYGPKLIGEGSAFGTGQFFAFTAAVAVAQLRAKYGHSFPALLLLAISAGGAWLSQSRISIGVVAVCVAVLLVLASKRGKLLNFGRTALAAVILWLAAEYVIPQLQGRQSLEGVEAGVDVRVDRVWGPLLDVLANNPFLGAGPGGLVGELPIEAHNIYLRAVVDYGLFVGLIFISIFVHVMFRGLATSRNPDMSVRTRLFGNLAFLAVLGVLVSGFVQDSLTGVMSSHLTMLAIGLLAGAMASSQDEPEPAVKVVPHARTRWLPVKGAATHRRTKWLPSNQRSLTRKRTRWLPAHHRQKSGS